ncbi:MAG: LptF/LptG family permease [Cyclobacteriaceae bacterium]|nr:LptF/LptG family permease [Cyclobacteriaceae bacterium]
MKKVDKLILQSFIGPFILSFFVVVFILLTQHMLKYFDDIIGKDLGWDVIGQLLFYFAVFLTPSALPLGVLFASLIAFGNLGEHFELTAVKSAGVSLLRVIRPIFIFVLLLTVIAFHVNNNLVPRAALEAYSLLYDIKQKKPALELREGTFYNGIPEVSIKVDEKLPDGITLKNILIYDHRKRDGNKDVTIADSGRMYTIYNQRYLKLELFNGYNYTEGSQAGQDLTARTRQPDLMAMSKSRFDRSQLIFDLSSFSLNRTDKKWFQGNRIMRNLRQLEGDLDSIQAEIQIQQNKFESGRSGYFANLERDVSSVFQPVEALPATVPGWRRTDSVSPQPQPHQASPQQQVRPTRRWKLKMLSQKSDSAIQTILRQAYTNRPDSSAIAPTPNLAQRIDSLLNTPEEPFIISQAAARARMVRSEISNALMTVDVYKTEWRTYHVQWHKIWASSLACIAMFLIGGPLGAIIKKGGLGVPFIVSVFFFILYYMLSILGEKWAKTGLIPVVVGVWAADVIFVTIGLVFLRQARRDARLFDTDYYLIALEQYKKKLQNWFRKGK